MKRFHITTLGCKVNQCESAALSSIFESCGGSAAQTIDQSEIVVINTCTVTGKAAMQSRQAVRQAIRRNPNATIVVTGCYAQTAPQEIQTIKGVDLIVGHADKLRIAEFACFRQQEAQSPMLIRKSIRQAAHFDAMPSVSPLKRTRAFLKIQDGCDAFCTYCIVPHARGRSRSMPVADVAQHIATLTADGFQEVVLTGIHLGVYGQDLTPPTSLAALLSRLAHETNRPRIRISSIEPTEIEAALINLAADPQSCVCPHFHVPLQSGDNDVLKRMGRPYTREMFAEAIMTVRQALPNAAIGVDIMAGFPGESDEAFEHSYELIRTLPITYLHVFPFSPRKGTPAATFSNKISDSVVKVRSQRLRELGEKKKTGFFQSQIDRTVTILIETNRDHGTGMARGLSDNYIPVSIPDSELVENTFVDVRIVQVRSDGCVIGKPAAATTR
ncbi:MAG: tRNA (N(6)-L-threonylcarbamoyladenosine(37)-C(2))-methylthiotransferase MtaB [Desulfobacteraceae bacterium]